jgi:DNA-binding NtrC family response regulator
MRAQGHEVQVAVDGEAALEAVTEFDPELMLLDMKMPKMDGFEVLEALRRTESPPQVVMITAHGNIERAVRAIQSGAADFIAKPFEAAQLDHIVSRVLQSAGLRQRLQHLQAQLSDRHTLVRGGSKAMKEALGLAGRAAASNATVLLLGESGSGKEVMARHIHQQSPRAEGPFIALNCATLTGDLLESELFGHEKGAFTGAHKAKPGSIELAEGGTLFLDEVGELGVGAQAKLLRVLQERQFQRVGGTRTLDADIRIVAATTASSARPLPMGRFAKTSTIDSTWFRFGYRRSETGPRICNRSSSTRLLDTPPSFAALL